MKHCPPYLARCMSTLVINSSHLSCSIIIEIIYRRSVNFYPRNEKLPVMLHVRISQFSNLSWYNIIYKKKRNLRVTRWYVNQWLFMVIFNVYHICHQGKCFFKQILWRLWIFKILINNQNKNRRHILKIIQEHSCIA